MFQIQFPEQSVPTTSHFSISRRRMSGEGVENTTAMTSDDLPSTNSQQYTIQTAAAASSALRQLSQSNFHLSHRQFCDTIVHAYTRIHSDIFRHTTTKFTRNRRRCVVNGWPQDALAFPNST